MDKMLSKLGLYDIIVVWLTGVMIFLSSFIIINEVYDYLIQINFYLKNPIVIIAGGYFIGMVFQEIGNFLERNLFNQNHRIIKSILTKKESFLTRNTSLTVQEQQYLLKYVPNCNEKNYRDAYNLCKHRLSSGTDISNIDKDQVSAVISRSLGVFFTFVSIATALFAVHLPCETSISMLKLNHAELLFLFLSALFVYRAYRFARIRYIRYFRELYFMETEKSVVVENLNRTTQLLKNLDGKKAEQQRCSAFYVLLNVYLPKWLFTFERINPLPKEWISPTIKYISCILYLSISSDTLPPQTCWLK